jgi:HEAT repeat protein
VLVLLVVSCSVRVHADEKTYNGRTLAEWRQQIQRLDFTDPSRGKFVTGLMEIVADPDVPWYSRRQASLTLGRMGDAAEPAISLLESLLADERPDAATCPQSWAAKALGLMGPLAAPTTETLVKVLWSETAGDLARLSAIDALSRIGTAHPHAIPALIELLDRPVGHSDFQLTRSAACEAIKFVGPAASPAIPRLLRLLESSDETLRRLALEALGSIGPAADFAAPAVFDAMTLDESPAVADAAEAALKQMGHTLEPQLVQLLAVDDEVLKRRCLRVLGSWKPRSRESQTAIEDIAFSATDGSTRLEALTILWPDPKRDTRWQDSLLACLIDEDRDVRLRALRLLAQPSPNASALAARLEQELQQTDTERELLIRALNALRPDEPPMK